MKPFRFSKLTFSLDPSSIQHAFVTFIIVAFCYLVLREQPSPQAPWLLLSAVLFSQAGLKAESHWQRVWGTVFYLVCGLLAAISVFILSLGLLNIIYKIPLTVLVVFSTTYVGWLKRQYFFAALIMNLLSLMAVFLPCDILAALARANLVFLGSLVVFVLCSLSFFYRRKQTLYYAKATFFQRLSKVYALIFYSAGTSRLPFRFQLEESHFQMAWSRCLSALDAFKGKISSADHQPLECIWDLTLSLGSLRYRLSDPSVLRMSQEELELLLLAIFRILDHFRRLKPNASFNEQLDAFQAAITKFEEIYQSMLQTVSKEPLVLLLFIQDLYALKNAFEKLSQSLEQPSWRES